MAAMLLSPVMLISGSHTGPRPRRDGRYGKYGFCPRGSTIREWAIPWLKNPIWLLAETFIPGGAPALLRRDVLAKNQPWLDIAVCHHRCRRCNRAEQLDDGLFGGQPCILVDDHVGKIVDQVAAGQRRQVVADEDRLAGGVGLAHGARHAET